MIIYVNIGSNLGNRNELIQQAIDRISDNFGFCCLSSFIESEPWGFESANRFLNLGVSFKSELDPETILRKLLEIEKSISSCSHRNKFGDYIDRKIDIDIMAIDDMAYQSDNLVIPHPHLFKRDFFMIPLSELNPDLFLCLRSKFTFF